MIPQTGEDRPVAPAVAARTGVTCGQDESGGGGRGGALRNARFGSRYLDSQCRQVLPEIRPSLVSQSAPVATLTGRDVVRHFLRHEVKAIAALELSTHHQLDAEGVHQLRVSARRLRSELRAMRSVLGHTPWREVERDLQWVGTVLGELRDLDVLAALFERHVEEGSPLHRSVSDQLDRRRKSRRTAVTRLLASRRFAHVSHQLKELSHEPHLGRVGRIDATDLFTPVLWEASCTFLDAVGESSGHRDERALHEVRIAAKKCRYNFEIAALFLGDEAQAVATSLTSIQDVLGQLHDRVVALSFLDACGFDDPSALEVRRTLCAEISQLRPTWEVHFVEARRGILEIFAPGPDAQN